MYFDVMLFKLIGDGYTARPILWPDHEVHGTTKQEALNAVRALIHDLIARTQLIRVEVDASAVQTDNPWITKAGAFTDDPTWDDFLGAMTDYRRSLDDVQSVMSV